MKRVTYPTFQDTFTTQGKGVKYLLHNESKYKPVTNILLSVNSALSSDLVSSAHPLGETPAH